MFHKDIMKSSNYRTICTLLGNVSFREQFLEEISSYLGFVLHMLLD